MTSIGPAQKHFAIGQHGPKVRLSDLERDSSEFAGVPVSPIPAVNVAQVPQRSPLRYPGGKTWLIPHVRFWLKRYGGEVPILIEPFAGGGIVSLTAVIEGLAKSCLMIELDRDVAAVWHSILSSGAELAKRVSEFEPTPEAVESLMASPVQNIVDHGFRTLVINRMRRGGILAAGASFAQVDKKGKLMAPRWYPKTLERRIKEIRKYKEHIRFKETDGIDYLKNNSQWIQEINAVLFVDPPYTMGGKSAGKRLYTHWKIDHSALFDILENCGVDFMMTYDCTDEILELVRKHNFNPVQVIMKNTHHKRIPELIITNSALFDG